MNVRLRNIWLTHELKAFTENSITDKEVFRQELMRTRQRGYAIDDMEHEFGIKCVAMPIFDRNRNLYAAISISGLATILPVEHMCGMGDSSEKVH
ncbi:MAG: IclR family transcriptional regulator C-terminal domain-containing protein [Blautia sp.]